MVYYSYYNIMKALMNFIETDQLYSDILDTITKIEIDYIMVQDKKSPFAMIYHSGVMDIISITMKDNQISFELHSSIVPGKNIN